MNDPKQNSDSRRSLVIVPTYNERENLPELVSRIPSSPTLDILFIDDNSNDGSANWIKDLKNKRPGIHLIERPSKMGLGTAYITGFKWALKQDYEFIFEMDADLSHDPAEIPNFIKKIDDGADLVIGSRYLDGIRVLNWPWDRLVLSRVAGFYTRVLTRLPLTDPTSGFKCFRRKVLEGLDLDQIRSNGYAFQIEMEYYAWKKKFRLTEIPITFTDRYHGTSKMNRQIVWEAIRMVPLLQFRSLLKSR